MFTVSDNTEHANGTFENETELVSFLQRKFGCSPPSRWGDLYNVEIKDENGCKYNFTYTEFFGGRRCRIDDIVFVQGNEFC